MDSLDVFVSYAWRDNAPPQAANIDPSTNRWVWMFQKALETHLGIKLGRDAKVWIDKREVKTNERVEAVLTVELARSSLLLALMSPSWIASSWCARELEEFLRTHPGTETSERVFMVEIEPVERQRWRIPVKGMKFYKEDPDGSGCTRFGHPIPTLDDREFYRHVASLAAEIKDALHAPDSTRTATEESLSAHNMAAESMVPTLWISDPGPGLLIERQDVIEAVRQAGFRVATPNIADIRSLPPPQQLKALRDSLRDASMLVQLIDKEVGESLSDGRSWFRFQADEAMKVATERAAPYLRWRRPGTVLDTIVDLSHRELLTGAIEQGLEELRNDIIARLKATKQPSPQKPETLNYSPFSLCMSFAEEDEQVAREVGTMLDDLDISYLGFPSPTSFTDAISADQRCSDEDRAIAQSNGVILIYGSAAREWLTTKIMRVNQLRGRKRTVWGALIDSPPKAKPMPPMATSIQRHDWRDRPRFDLLREFVQSLRATHV